MMKNKEMIKVNVCDDGVGRNSSIESLKILAVIMIVLSHSGFYTIDAHPDQQYLFIVDMEKSTSDVQIFLHQLFRNMGQIGNAIFIICSSWFLIDDKAIKVNKILHVIGDCFLISISAVLLFCLLGYDFSAKILLKQFMPVTFANSWFVTCYLILYAIHPMLNIILDKVSQTQLLRFNLSFFVLYNVMSFTMKKSLFFIVT